MAPRTAGDDQRRDVPAGRREPVAPAGRRRPALVIVDDGRRAELVVIADRPPPETGAWIEHRGARWRISRRRDLARTLVAVPPRR